MIDTKNLKDGDKVTIWTVSTCPCGCELEGKKIKRNAVFINGQFQEDETYEVFGSSVIKYKKEEKA